MKTADDDARYELHVCHCESCSRVRKAIKLDAMKEGMRMATLHLNDPFKTNRIKCGASSDETKQAILSAAEQLTEKDL